MIKATDYVYQNKKINVEMIPKGLIMRLFQYLINYSKVNELVELNAKIF